MERNTLDATIGGISSIWGPLTTGLVAGCRRHLETLLQASASEPWLEALLRDAPPRRELYRDPVHGFVLQAHTEEEGRYRVPHDHGRGWVIYAVLRGRMEMGTYARIQGPEGGVRLVKRDSAIVLPGQVQVYLPGDIHDTRCLSGPALQLRLTDRDLVDEDRREGRVTRYEECDGGWRPAGA